MNSYKLGTVLGGTDDVYLTDDDLAVHTAVLGGSGSGKSKFLERLGRCFLEASTGFAYIPARGHE
jgi:ABC-type transporter Mla maintaining outer membrane lipid asymmetry ATPase subunit MlaF